MKSFQIKIQVYQTDKRQWTRFFWPLKRGITRKIALSKLKEFPKLFKASTKKKRYILELQEAYVVGRVENETKRKL